MKIDLTKILLFVLVICVLVIGYGVFRTDNINYSPQLVKSEIIIEQLTNDKKTFKNQLIFLQEQYSILSLELKQKNEQISNKDKQIKYLQKVLYEKIDSINNMDNNGNFILFSNWISENN